MFDFETAATADESDHRRAHRHKMLMLAAMSKPAPAKKTE